MTQWNGVSFRDNLAHDAPRQPAKRLISALAVRNARHDVAEAALAHTVGPLLRRPTFAATSSSCAGP